MKKTIILPLLALAVVFSGVNTAMHAQTVPTESGDLVNMAAADTTAFKVENGATATYEDVNGAKALNLAFQASGGYPGLDFVPASGTWDLTGYTGIIVTVVNNSTVKVGVGLRVDNAGDWKQSPWNSEVDYLPAGATKTINVTFGKSYGKPGFALDPSGVKKVKVMVTQPKGDGSLSITSVKAVK